MGEKSSKNLGCITAAEKRRNTTFTRFKFHCTGDRVKRAKAPPAVLFLHPQWAATRVTRSYRPLLWQDESCYRRRRRRREAEQRRRSGGREADSPLNKAKETACRFFNSSVTDEKASVRKKLRVFCCCCCSGEAERAGEMEMCEKKKIYTVIRI